MAHEKRQFTDVLAALERILSPSLAPDFTSARDLRDLARAEDCIDRGMVMEASREVDKLQQGGCDPETLRKLRDHIAKIPVLLAGAKSDINQARYEEASKKLEELKVRSGSYSEVEEIRNSIKTIHQAIEKARAANVSGRFAEALAALKEMSKFGWSEGHIERGKLAAEADAGLAAERELTDALEKGNLALAKESWMNLRKRVPRHERASEFAAAVANGLVKQKDLRGAESVLIDWLGEHPDDAQARNLLGTIATSECSALELYVKDGNKHLKAGTVCAIVMDRDEHRLLTAHSNRRQARGQWDDLYVWKVGNDDKPQVFSLHSHLDPEQPNAAQFGHTREIKSIASGADGKWLVSGGQDGRIFVWKWEEGVPRVHTQLGSNIGKQLTESMAFYATGNQLVLLARPNEDSPATVSIWDVATGQRIEELKDSAGVSRFALSPDGKYLATAREKQLEIWDARDFRSLGKFADHKDQITALAFSRDGQHVASAALNTIYLRKIGDDNPPKTRDIGGNIKAAGFLRDSSVVAMSDNKLTQWRWKEKSPNDMKELRIDQENWSLMGTRCGGWNWLMAGATSNDRLIVLDVKSSLQATASAK